MPTKEARDAFVAARVATAIGLRIFNMRKKRNWSQEDFASEAGMKQARISVLEQADYENFSFSTLRRIAAAFGVAVIIDFVSFPDFLKWSDGFTSSSIVPESYADSLLRPAQAGDAESHPSRRESGRQHAWLADLLQKTDTRSEPTPISLAEREDESGFRVLRGFNELANPRNLTPDALHSQQQGM